MKMRDYFHQAAKEGRLCVLRQATELDLNQEDDGGRTPTLWTAYHGNLEALKLCCRRGGNPDNADYFGNTALHFAAANGHLRCLQYLVSIGANIWQMDNDYHTPMEIAAVSEKPECIQYLDTIAEEQKRNNTKRVADLQKRAKKEADKQIEKYNKRQREQDKTWSRIHGRKSSADSEGADQITPVSDPGTTKPPQRRKSSTQKQTSRGKKISTSSIDEFYVSELKDGTRTIKSISGFRSEVQDVIFMPSGRMNKDSEQGCKDSRPAKIGKIFGGTIRSNPGAASSMYSALDIENQDEIAATVQTLLPSNVGDSDDEEELTELDTFLETVGLAEYSLSFKRERIDMEILMGLTSKDLIDLHLTEGGRRKLLNAIEERKTALALLPETEITTL